MKANLSTTSAPTTLSEPGTTAGQISTYAELQHRIHEDLRMQHPEWVEPNGESPICDSYESRLTELIGLFQSIERASAA